MSSELSHIINTAAHPLESEAFRAKCKAILGRDGALVMPDFLTPDTITSIQHDGASQQHLAYYTSNNHNIYLMPADTQLPPDHPRNKDITSSKGCITTNQIPKNSNLHAIYDSRLFREFLCAVLGEDALYEYADPLSSINLHYAAEGQELGWHFDNSSFAITLMIQAPEDGGAFEYVKDVRDADNGDMGFDAAKDVLGGKTKTQTLRMEAGTLVLFRGRNSMHRVTPVKGDKTRMLVVFAYNSAPNIALSESARMTFFGRLE